MKNFDKLKIAVTASMVLGTAIQADYNSPAELYQYEAGTSVFSANNLYIQTGWYNMDGSSTGDDPELAGSNFVGSYYFGHVGDTWRPFVTGGIGFTNMKQSNTTVNFDSTGKAKLESWYGQVGGGINYNPEQHISLVLGGSALWMQHDAHYSGTPSPEMKKYFEHDSDTALYDIYLAGTLHGEYNGYKPYLTLTAHYLTIDYDYDFSNTNGWSGDAEAGVFSPILTYWWDLPVRARFFVAGTFLDNDLSDITEFDNFFTGGGSLLWKIGPKIHILNNAFKDTELSFNLQGTTGDNDLSGWKASLSFFIAKF